MKGKRNRSIIISYKTLRQSIGWLGIALPVVLVVGGWIVQPGHIEGSISSYYYTNMRDLLVGILGAVGVFLITYQGYDRLDNWVTNGSGLAAFGIALFPSDYPADPPLPVGIFHLPSTISVYFHLVSAACFFLLLAYNAFFLFTKTGTGRPGPRKLLRNLLYRLCGITIVACLVGIGLYLWLWQDTFLRYLAPILALETLALWAFGFSWLVKGGTLFRDRP
ncbi:MAG: hypothetical protein N2509_02125 [Treponemataceae bacterium]|nr:hypothetical protein [Treponemataceae bacterium]